MPPRLTASGSFSAAPGAIAPITLEAIRIQSPRRS